MENNNNFRISLVFYKILSFLSFVVGGILGYITYSFNIYGLIIVLIYIAIFKHLLNYLFVERAAAGLYSTAGDLARLLNEAYFLYSREDYQGKVISNNSLKIMAKPLTNINNTSDMGFGYFITSDNDNRLIISHSGRNIGWTCTYALELQSGRGIVILTNSDCGGKYIKSVLEYFNRILE